MHPDESRYIRFNATQVTQRGSEPRSQFSVTAPSGQAYRLSEAELGLARLYDGERDADARLRAAIELFGPSVTAADMARFTDDLVETGLLDPGREEPLPPPQQLADRITDRDRSADEHEDAYPPSSMPGSMANPGNQGRLDASGSGPRGGHGGRGFSLPATPFVVIGHALNVALYFAPVRWLLWLLVPVALFGLWQNRIDATADAELLLAPFHLLGVAAVSALLVNLFSQSARAAAIARYTDDAPSVRLRLGLGFVPRLETETEGAAERADARGRRHIIGSSLNATLGIFVLAVSLWLLVGASGTLLPTFLLGFAALSMAGFLFRLNPLARRDGYYLLAHALHVPDLRDQAWTSLFGYERAWHQGEPPPAIALRLYALAIGAYIVAVVALLLLYPARWLGDYYGGTGVVIFLAVMALIGWEQSRRVRSDRQSLEPVKLRLQAPSRLQWLIIGLIAAAALFPYTYEPSGRITVLPVERADIRALVAGDVREVLVGEGDRVSVGQEIARLDDAQQRSQIARSEARIRKLEAEMRLLDAGAADEEIAVAEQRVATSRERAEFASAEARRAERAFSRKAISSQEYESALSNASVRQEELAEAEQQLSLVSRAAREDERATLEAEADAERATLEFLRSQLADTRIKAPIAGVVVSDALRFAQGRFLERGELIGVVEDQTQLMVEAMVPESIISEVAAGAPVRVRSWTAPGESVSGKVDRIAPSVEETRYGKAVRVMIELQGDNGHLQPGMTGRAKITGGTYPAAVVFTRALTRFVLVEVWSWLP